MILIDIVGLLTLLTITSAQSPDRSSVLNGASADVFPGMSDLPEHSYLSLVLLALTVSLSGGVYICVLRYICVGCCQPVLVGPEEIENISGVV